MFWAILENFGKIEKNEPKLSGGGAKSGLLRILESNFFLGPVTFRKIEISKKNFFWPEINPFPRCEIGFVNIGSVSFEIDPLRKKDFSKNGFFFTQPPNGPYAVGAEKGFSEN